MSLDENDLLVPMTKSNSTDEEESHELLQHPDTSDVPLNKKAPDEVDKLKNSSVEPIKQSEEADNDANLVEASTSTNPEETRVITLDTIIRKGLVEQMPMTAKDIENILPNAMRKDRERLEADIQRKQNECLVINDSSDEESVEYTSDKEEEDEVPLKVDELPESVMEHQNSEIEDETPVSKETEIKIAEPSNKDGKVTPTKETLIEPKSPSSTMAANRKPPMTIIPNIDENADADREFVKEMVSVAEPTVEATDDDDYSEFDSSADSFEDPGSSDSESSHSSQVKKKRRKSVAKPDSDPTMVPSAAVEGTTAQSGAVTAPENPPPRLNKRGRPRKVYDESEFEPERIVKRRRSRKLKIQPYTGPKRKPGRPRRTDGVTSYGNFRPNVNSSLTTPMDELMAMGHSLFSDYRPKKIGRPRKRDNYDYLTGDESFPNDMDNMAQDDPSQQDFEDDLIEDEDMYDQLQRPLENMLMVQHNVPEDNNNPATSMMFRRKPGRPKIDKESGGQIVFQNSELTVVNKIGKLIKSEVVSTSSSSMGHDSHDDRTILTRHNLPTDRTDFHALMRKKSDIEIVPIPNLSNRFVLPRDTTIQCSTTVSSSGHSRNSYQNVRILQYTDGGGGGAHTTSTSSTYNDRSMLIAPIDDMLEVHHVEDYTPGELIQPKKRGRKPKHESIYARNMYSDYASISMESPPIHQNVSTPVEFKEHKKRGRKPKSLFEDPSQSSQISTPPPPLTPRPSNGPSISVKNINELLANPTIQPDSSSTNQLNQSSSLILEKSKRIRKPKNMDFPYEIPTTSRKSIAAANELLAQRRSTGSTDPGACGALMNKQMLNRLIGKPIRDRRMSLASKPTYAEWSESSSDNHDIAMTMERKRKEQQQQHQLYEEQRTPKVHWKTQLKLDRLAREEAGLPPIETKRIPKNQPDNDTFAKQGEVLVNSNDTSAPNVEITSIQANQTLSSISADGHADVVAAVAHSIFDPFEHNKRIPKLKYGSFNFNERRDKSANKPKMVLKYKKKYKKKPKKLLMSTPREGNTIADVPVNGTDPSLPSAEATASAQPLSERKKTGPKSKLSLNELTQPVVKRKWVRRQLVVSKAGRQRKNLKEPIRIKRKYVKRQILPEGPDKPQDDDPDNPIHKRKLDDFESSSQSSSKAVDGTDQRLKKKHKRRQDGLVDDDPDKSTNNVYLENYNRVLQERNKVLMEILEQRSAEIRNLKLRVSNMVKKADTETKEEEMDTQKGDQHSDETAWSMAELAKAYSLQKLSKTFYQYVQGRFSLPLPPSHDVNKYIGDIHLTRGIMSQMVQILEYDGETMTDMDRVTILQISQIELKPLFEYDIDMDNIIGPHHSLTIVVARGLYTNWAQAVYMNFDACTFKQSLNLVIEELHKIKFHVVAAVCKFVDGKPNIWNELGVNSGCNYFSHPITTDFIYAFYYIDDLLATMQLYFLRDGFNTDNGNSITKEPIEKVLQEKHTKVTLSKDVCSPTGNAIDLFSKQTANVLRLCSPGDESASICADFLNVISSFYQLMNSKKSYTTTSGNLAKLPYGKNLEYQNNILNEIQLHFYKIRCPGTKKLSDFQRATMMSIESLKMLQHATKQRYKIDSFATHNITSEYFQKQCQHVVAQQKRDMHNEDDDVMIERLSPLEAFAVVKEIFLQPTKMAGDDDHMAMPNETCFLDGDIDVAEPESHYVSMLIQWIADKYKDKHPISVGQANDDFVRKMHKFEEMFAAIQNPYFKIAEGSVTKVFKKLKSHTFGMFLDVIHTFVMQRHLLRIKYYNAIGFDGNGMMAGCSGIGGDEVKIEQQSKAEIKPEIRSPIELLTTPLETMVHMDEECVASGTDTSS